MRILVIVSILALSALSDSLCAKSRFETGGLTALSRDYNSMIRTKNPDLIKYTECVEKSGYVTANLMDCSGSEIENQDRQLNDNYKRLMVELGEQEKVELRKAQRLWVHDRDRTCNKISAKDGDGSLGGVIYSMCILFLTNKRKNELILFMKK